jgi:membrane protein implicated in regulation of membrane protease activity
MNSKLMWISGVLSAVVAAILCALPLILAVFVGTGALAFLPDWLDAIVAPIMFVVAAGFFYKWYRAKKTKTDPET